MENNARLDRMKELAGILNEASKAYYQESREIMSNLEYDALYDELLKLEAETGITLSGSPTVRVGYELLSKLPKEDHASPMLSLDKTKDPAALAAWLGDQEGLLSWKLDGLTIVLTYRGGELVKAVTRGNGITGEVITGNAKTFINLPLRISYTGELVLRGEAIISYSDFEKINAEIGEAEAAYKNPRNLCSGSVRQLNNAVTAKRRVQFHAFTLVSCEGVDFHNSRQAQFDWLKAQGFSVVYHRRVNAGNIQEAVKWFASEIEKNDIPSDGLVLTYDDIAYGESLGVTAKFPRHSIAFKWADEQGETTLREMEWGAARTGIITPVAIFDPVELEGTTVTRASVHNVSIFQAMKLAVGDRITVYKANMIIPQIAENLTGSGPDPVPEYCPVCGAKTVIQENEDVKVLVCPNPDCAAKQIKGFDLFVSRDAMNIEGISESTLEKWIAAGILHDFADLYHIEEHKEKIVTMEGFGEKSYMKILDAVNNSRHTTFSRLVGALGIPGIGTANAKLLSKAYGGSLEALRAADAEELAGIDGVGPITAAGIVKYFADPKNKALLDKLLPELTMEQEEAPAGSGFEGLTFVITGNVTHYANRKELQKEIESLGGKVSGSVSAKTSYLINNDSTSNSTKNRTARELGIPVITEEEYISLKQERTGE